MFTFKTSAVSVSRQKTLLYAMPGWGKTTQCRNYQARYGKGLIISGESGLSAIADCDIDYLPFTSYNGEHNPEAGVCSFVGILQMIDSPDFAAVGYQWIALDSLTELSDRLIEHLEHKYEGEKNRFAVWGDYARFMLAALKWLRDKPYHILVTALVEEDTEGDDLNGPTVTNYWPLVKGNRVSRQIPGIFDNVFAGLRLVTENPENKANPTIRRFVITDEVRGYHGKTRDPKRTLKAVEECDDITLLLERIRTGNKDATV
ncbi:AAA family ATPase [Aeromonas veronii]|uniref:AAA family ATPase n=1 Tax=Aeromonas veronii TaxID=654 RepID=UPI001C5BC20A|nr:AAA family ATPase [Aeromonas veronii]MBW3783717.1 AAA family ATPase [Aeromonas veronii]